MQSSFIMVAGCVPAGVEDKIFFSMVTRCVPAWLNVSARPFLCDYRIGSYMIICECWVCLSDMVLDVFLSWSDVSAGKAILSWCQI